MWRKNSFISLFMSSMYHLPTPVNISYAWNFSSLLSLFLVIQIVSGLFLTMHYVGNIMLAFDSVSHIVRDVNLSWLMRSIHANSASFFFSLMYVHICRSIYYKRYMNTYSWLVSVGLLLVSMLTGFLGYVLPWGQMSFWGATVITNFITAIPVFSEDIVQWVWGGFSVDNATLTRFYTFHFLFPFLIAVLSVAHLVFIHNNSSSNPLSNFSGVLKIPFWPYFGVKDILGFFVVLSVFISVVLFFPDVFSDPDNFFKANPMVTPVHIKPEWYFLFAYAILRCIPNKVMSVLALVLSVIIFAFMPLSNQSLLISYRYQLVFWLWVSNFVLLTWLGSCSVQSFYTYLSQICSFIYFLLIFLLMYI